jgi:thiaminase/transcriptional activator TenA
VTFSDDLRATAKTWDAVVGHRFVGELWAGRVEPAALAGYLLQDREVLGATFPLLAATGLPHEQARPRLDLFDQERNYLVRAMDALDVPLAARTGTTRTEATRALCTLMDGVYGGSDGTGCRTVLLVAEWLRLDCAGWAAADLPTEPLQREWIEIHRGTPFAAWVDSLRLSLDGAAERLDEKERDRIGALFTRTAELQLAFFDALCA